jgi:hypothetical protein
LANRYLEAEDNNELERIKAEGKDKFGEDFSRLVSLSDELQLARARAPHFTALQQYKNLAGEIEARNTADRSELSDEERAAQAPDIRADAIVIFGNQPVAQYSLADSAGNPEARAKFDAAPVAEVTGTEIPKTSTVPSQIRNNVIDWLTDKGWFRNFANEDTGWDNINISHSSIRDILFHGVGIGKVQAIAALPEIIKNGIYLQPGKVAANGNKRHIFASKLTINNEPFVVGFVVQEDVNGRKYYDHEMTEIRNLGSLGSQSLTDSGWPGANRDSVINIVRKHLGVKPDLTFTQSQDSRPPRGATMFSGPGL